MYNSSKPAPRLQYADRFQLRMETLELNTLIEEEHQARAVWLWVEKLDLTSLFDAMKARGSNPGRAAIDPHILLCLWLYATLEGIGSARLLARYCTEHNAFRWITGGVSVNYHTLSDFRVCNTELLDQLLTDSMAALILEGLVDLKVVAQDGMRVKASAGRSSFRRKKKLAELQQICSQQIETLKQELEADPKAGSLRQRAARQRAQRERQERLDRAVANMELMENKAAQNMEKQRRKPANKTATKGKKTTAKSKKDSKQAKEPRSSTTDPDARNMKMANGGKDPAYNIQYVTDAKTKLIVGCEVTNAHTDHGLMNVLNNQLKSRYGMHAGSALADGGYIDLNDITIMEKCGTKVYVPLKQRNPELPPPKRIRRKDTPQTLQWRARMETDEAQQLLKKRGETAEWVNAQARNHGLRQLMVRGQAKVRSIALMHALATNFETVMRLKAA